LLEWLLWLDQRCWNLFHVSWSEFVERYPNGDFRSTGIAEYLWSFRDLIAKLEEQKSEQKNTIPLPPAWAELVDAVNGGTTLVHTCECYLYKLSKRIYELEEKLPVELVQEFKSIVDTLFLRMMEAETDLAVENAKKDGTWPI